MIGELWTRLFPHVELREPWLLLTALLAIPVFLLARRPGARLTFSSFRLLPARTRTWRTRLAWVPAALLALSAALLGVALAGPRVGDRSARIQRKGIAVVMVLDVSGSMRALDLSEGDEERTRLDATKAVFLDFVLGDGGLPGRPDDAIGLVTFARYPDSRCPLTLDHDNLALLARDLEIVSDPEEDGTALGDGLALAIERLRESKARSRVAILLTDGVHNAGEMTPAAAAALARDAGVKVYTIGAGTNGFAPIRAEDPFTGRSVLRRTRVEIDEETLAEIARVTGGRAFRATDAATLRDVYAEIDRLERSEVAETRYHRWHEHHPTFTAAALLAASLAWLLGATVWRRLP